MPTEFVPLANTKLGKSLNQLSDILRIQVLPRLLERVQILKLQAENLIKLAEMSKSIEQKTDAENHVK